MSSVGSPQGVLAAQSPLQPRHATAALGRCVVRSVGLAASGQIRQPRGHLGWMLSFADGSTGRVYRETAVQPVSPIEPALLVVCFRLRAVRGRGHTAFRAESLLNTPLFVGFPGFVSKLWLAHDGNQVYRGVYQWDGAARADAYARALWWVLALVSRRESIAHVVVPGLWRDEVLADPSLLDLAPGGGEWWRLTRTAAP